MLVRGSGEQRHTERRLSQGDYSHTRHCERLGSVKPSRSARKPVCSPALTSSRHSTRICSHYEHFFRRQRLGSCSCCIWTISQRLVSSSSSPAVRRLTLSRRLILGYHGTRDRLSLYHTGEQGVVELKSKLVREPLDASKAVLSSLRPQTQEVLFCLLNIEGRMLLITYMPEEGVSGVQRGKSAFSAALSCPGAAQLICRTYSTRLGSLSSCGKRLPT